MPMFKLPLSGDVTQTINPWTAVFSPTIGQWGLVNITIGQSSAPEVEADVLTDVAGYGKQLGRIGDVVAVLLKHLPPDKPLSQPAAPARWSGWDARIQPRSIPAWRCAAPAMRPS